MFRTLILLTATALVLTSCFTGEDLYDQVVVVDPVVTVSTSSAKTGALVEVHVKSTYYVSIQSRVAAFAADVQLGVCLVPDWLATEDGVTPTSDNCWDPALYGTAAYFEPTDDFTLAPGEATSVLVPTTIERGQTIDIEHSFSIAAERAGTVKMLGMLYAHSTQNSRPWGTSFCIAKCGFVTWE